MADVFDYCGEPGLVWYSKVTKKRGDELQIGDWLDVLDHSGARMICAIGIKPNKPGVRWVAASAWYFDIAADDPDSDWELIRDDVVYDVVDPDSICDPMGNPA